jgi:hypothetical protein
MEPIVAIEGHAVGLVLGAAQVSMKVDIHNKCSNIELVEPMCFSDGAVCYTPLDQKVEPGGVLETVFRIKSIWGKSEGALLCRLRKKGADSDQQSDSGTTNIDEDWSNHARLLVGWKLERPQDLRVYMLLIEHGEKLVWTEDKLLKQHNDFRGRLRVHNGAVEDTWLMEDGSVLKLALDGVGNREYGIRIAITNAQQNEHTSIPLWIEPIV